MRTRNKLSTLVIVLVLVVLMSSTVMAQSGKIVEVKGRDHPAVLPENRGQLPITFSVSNVVDVFDPAILGIEIEDGFVVESPSDIKLVLGHEYGFSFMAYPLYEDGGVYKYSYDSILPVDGEATVYVKDESSGVDENGYYQYIEKVVPTSELYKYPSEDEFEMFGPHYLEGASIKLTKPGYYFVMTDYEFIEGGTAVVIKVKGESEVVVEEKEEIQEKELKAIPSSSKILVNGNQIDFDAYLIEDNNYFKLRDLAFLLSASTKKFGVNYNEEKKAINLISNELYTPVGGEMTKGSGMEKSAILNTSKIYKDGEEVELKAYNIDGNNYFKLRDLGKAFNIGIGWDNETKTITIDTSTNYTE